MVNKKKGNEQKCLLVIFVSLISRCFWALPFIIIQSSSSKYRIVARFACTMKENIKKKLCSVSTQNKMLVIFFSAPSLPGKSGLGKVFKWRKIKHPPKALYLNTGNKMKSKYCSQKIPSSIESGSKQFKSRLMWCDWV